MPTECSSDPRDGVDTRLLARSASGEQAVIIARIAAGGALVSRPQAGSGKVVFDYFREQTLAVPRTVIGVDVVGDFVWQQRPEPKCGKPGFQIRASSTSPYLSGVGGSAGAGSFFYWRVCGEFDPGSGRTLARA